MKNPLGKTNKEAFNKKMAKEVADEVTHKRKPDLSKRNIKKMARSAKRSVKQDQKKGFSL